MTKGPVPSASAQAPWWSAWTTWWDQHQQADPWGSSSTPAPPILLSTTCLRDRTDPRPQEISLPWGSVWQSGPLPALVPEPPEASSSSSSVVPPFYNFPSSLDLPDQEDDDDDDDDDDEDQARLRVAFRNGTRQTLLLCWMDDQGRPHHFYRLKPWASWWVRRRRRGGRRPPTPPPRSLWTPLLTSGVVSEDLYHDHIEQTSPGHCFVVAAHPYPDQAARARSLDGVTWWAAYRPLRRQPEEPHQNEEKDDDQEEKKDPKEDEDDDEEEKSNLLVHLVTIEDTDLASVATSPEQTLPPNEKEEEGKEEEICCGGGGGPGALVRRRLGRWGRPHAVQPRLLDSPEAVPPSGVMSWRLCVRMARLDATPLDTTGKAYARVTLGGWPLRVQAQWPADQHADDDVDQDDGDEQKEGGPRIYSKQEFEALLEKDLQQLAAFLPPAACKALKRDTYLWVNCTSRYGPKASPVRARYMCYHPDAQWLQDHGMHRTKARCVELYDAQDYCVDRDYWGTGGLLLHEFSHAYHHKCLPQGYDNPEILACYEAAMEEGLYDSVEVKGPQGPKARHYACTNAMEYFAELSTAFLGGTNGEEKYNKWYPFNRKQVREHDPRAYALLQRLWKVDDDS